MDTSTGARPEPVSGYLLKWFVTIFPAIVIFLIPTPQGLADNAFHLGGIFVATIIGIVIQPLPMSAMALLAIVVSVTTNTLTIQDALSGFSNKVVWLVVSAFFISQGFIKTGLGARIAYFFMALLGKRSLGLSYGFLATDLLLSTVIPSSAARCAGILFPIIRSTAKSYGSDPETNSSRKIGSFLMYTSFQGINITSAMFVTAMAANPLILDLALGQGVQLSWGLWAAAASVPGIISLLVIPYIIYKLYPPEIKDTQDAAKRARAKLAEMGRMQQGEGVMLITFGTLLCLWIFGPNIGLDSTTAALLGLAILLITRTLTWQDILNDGAAWNTFIWFSVLVTMAGQLNTLGLIPWFGDAVEGLVEGTNWMPAFLVLILIYFYSHYFFASNTAHVTSMYAPFLVVALTLGTPGVMAALALGFISNLFSCTTHYGTSPAPVYFGAGYVDMNTWWRLGFLISIVIMVIWVGIGGLWWRFLGIW
jgi:DASS family divalent anion:Na+ symporter